MSSEKIKTGSFAIYSINGNMMFYIVPEKFRINSFKEKICISVSIWDENFNIPKQILHEGLEI